MIIAAKMMANIFNLTMTVVTGRNDIGRPGGCDLVEFYPAVRSSFIGKPGLQSTTAATAAVIIVSVGNGINKIFFTHNGLDHKSQVIHNLVGPALSADIAGVLHGKLGLDVFIPVGIDFQFSFPDPLGIEFNNGDQLKFMRNIIFAQSFQDRKV